MVRHSLCLVIQLSPSLASTTVLRNRISAVHVFRFSLFLLNALTTDPAFVDVAVAERIQELAFEGALHVRVACGTEAKYVLVLVRTV